MGKYLELFLGEVGDLTEKTKLENKPYVAYSTKLGKVTYTVVPASTPDEPVIEGPADNEIWYTTVDGSLMSVPASEDGDWIIKVGNNVYEDGKGIMTLVGIDIEPNFIPNNFFSDSEDYDKLTSINISDSMRSVGYKAFINCSSLVTFVGKNVHTISGSAFENCTALTDFVGWENIHTIGDGAFKNCHSLASVTLSNNIKSIGKDAFYGTKWYDNQPDGMTYLGNLLYKYKGVMLDNTHIDVKEGTVDIVGGAFQNCTGLSSISIPDSVTHIGDSAFSGCSTLTSITIPNGVTDAGHRLFENCSLLKDIYYNGTKEQLDLQVIGFDEDYEFWNYNHPEFIVHCTDEDITIPANYGDEY